MPTLTQYREAMLATGPADLGAVYTLSSAAAQSATSATAAVGGFSAERWTHYYMLRREAVLSGGAAVDRERRCTSYNATTGAWTHTGAAYTDQTATDEEIELWKYDPKDVDGCINEVIKRIRRLQAVELPTLATGRYPLHALDWVDDPNDIERIEWSNSKVLSRNRFFDHYNTRTSAGVLQPDWWTLAGSGATMARSTTQLGGRSKYSLAITRSGADCTLTQSLGLLPSGVDGDSLAGQAVTGVLRGWSTEASQLRIGINDGVTTTYSDYHTGDETDQELTVEKTLASTATKNDLVIEVNTSNSVAYPWEAYETFGTLTDGDRRADYRGERVWSPAMEQGVSFPITLPARGRGSVYMVYTRRPYTQFTAARITAGLADADECDAPLEIVAVGALWLLYERLSRNTNVESTENAKQRAIAMDYRRRFERMALKHLVQSGSEHGAMPMKPRLWAAPVRSGTWR